MANGKIAPIKKGEDGLQCADVANDKVIDWLNALLAMTVSPEGAGSFAMSKGKCVLNIKGVGAQLTFQGVEAGSYQAFKISAVRA